MRSGHPIDIKKLAARMDREFGRIDGRLLTLSKGLGSIRRSLSTVRKDQQTLLRFVVGFEHDFKLHTRDRGAHGRL